MTIYLTIILTCQPSIKLWRTMITTALRKAWKRHMLKTALTAWRQIWVIWLHSECRVVKDSISNNLSKSKYISMKLGLENSESSSNSWKWSVQSSTRCFVFKAITWIINNATLMPSGRLKLLVANLNSRPIHFRWAFLVLLNATSLFA